jgi:hypothetical protein
MSDVPLSTINILVSGIMGMFGGAISVPVNAIMNWFLKSRELAMKAKLEEISHLRKLLLKHNFEMKDKKHSDTDALIEKINILNDRIRDIENR